MRIIAFGLLSLFVVLDATAARYVFDIYNSHRPILRRTHSNNISLVENSTIYRANKNVMYLPEKNKTIS